MSLPPSTSDVAVVRAEGVTKTYPGVEPVHALRGIDLVVEPGEMLAIMGSSGSGKSTLMNLLGCLDRPTAGRLWLDGVDVASLDRDALAALRNRKLGFVFQGFQLLARTSARENVELPLLYDPAASARESRRRAVEALERVGLGDRLDHPPNQLSGGQQQRVAIARALVNRPRLLLADEPTGNLDSATTREILALFQELNADGVTLVIVTHEVDVARAARRVIVLEDGRIVDDHPVEDRLELVALTAADRSAETAAPARESDP